MVSVPDWARSQRSQPLKTKVSRPALDSRERYELSLERQAIREAENKGYFLVPQLNDIVRDFGQFNGKDETGRDDIESVTSQISHVKSIIYSGKHIRTLGDVGMFTQLKVLMLDNNYLQDITQISGCSRLIMLGLHSNQLCILPDAGFWSDLRQLQVLLLHDNPIDSVDIVHALASCPQLCALTLYDTPLSLKKNYRHHVVNSLYSLKALDRYVVSDEEIIEDAVFRGSRFSAMSSSFSINMTPSVTADMSANEVVRSAMALVAKINRIASHCCPVLVLQKFFRGWLVRKKNRPRHQARPRAIQVKNTQRKQISAKRSSGLSVLLAEGRLQERQHTTSPVNLPVASPLPVAAAAMSAPGNKTSLLTTGQPGIVIDISRLKESVTKQLHQDDSSKKCVSATAAAGDQPSIGKTDFNNEKRANITTHGMGDAGTIDVRDYSAQFEGTKTADDGLSLTHFRLRGRKSIVKYYTPIEQTITACKDAGHDLRDMVADVHERLAARPKPSISKSYVRVKDRFLFMRLQETMSLSCLRAVHQAYEDRQLEEAAADRADATVSKRQQREAAKASVHAFSEEKRLAVLKQREADKKSMLETDEKLQLNALHEQNLANERKQKALRKKIMLKSDQTFVNDFRTQQTSVSKALLRHDWQSKKDGVLTERCQTVASAKDSQKEKQHIIKKFLEHRSLLRQTENSVTKAAIDGRILQTMSDHLEEVRSRVTTIRSKKYQAPLPYSVPNVTVSIPSVPAVPNATPDWRSDFRSAADSRCDPNSVSFRRDRSSRLQLQI